MKKLLLSIFTVLLSAVMMSAEEVTFDFANETYGLTRHSDNSGAYIDNGTVVENGGVSVTLNKTEGKNGWRMWTDGLRAYKNSDAGMTITASSNISAIEFTMKKNSIITAVNGTAVSGTSFSYSTSGTTVDLAYTVENNGAILSMKVILGESTGGGENPGTGGDGGEEPDPETQTVATLTDFIAAAPTANTTITGAVTVYYQSPDKKYTFITDGTSNLQVYGSLTNAYSNGDQLTGITGKMGEYGGMAQMVPVVESFGTATAGTPVQPKTATLAQEIAPCEYVTLSGINITGVSGKNATLSDGTNTLAAYDRFSVTLSEVEGATVVGIGAVYNGNKQLYIVSVNGGEQGGGDEPVDPTAKGGKDNPYTVTEVIALNNPGTKSQWVKGYIIGVINYDNGSQLELGASSTVKTCLAIAASPSETDKANCVAVQLPNNSIRTALNLVDNPGNAGKEVSVCGDLEKYFGIAGVKNLSDYVLGEGGGDPVTPPTGTEGDGSEMNPYTVADAISLGNPGTTGKWVNGIIVGVMNYVDGTGNVFSATELTTNSNIVIAATAEDFGTNYVAVQLPGGKVRDDLNLVDRPGNLGKEVSVCGDLIKYCGVTGVKNTTDYNIVGGLAPLPVGETESLTSFVEDQCDTNTKITGTVTVYYQSPDKKYTFITDGETNLEVYAAAGLANTYVNGDQLTGIIGKFGYYQNMPQFVPQVDSFGEAASGAAVQPVETTLSNVMPADFVMIKNATIVSETVEDKTTYTVSDASGSRILFDRFAIGGIVDATNVNILGIGAVFGEDAQLFPIEITPATDGISEITTENSDNIVIYDLQGRKLAAPVKGINIINGRKVLVK